jgi:hypothetical protein
VTEGFQPGDSVLFMKVGTHAKESLEEIIERKRREIEEAGFSMWGYGGNTCHPTTMVQPFARRAAATGRILLCMHPMVSNHFAEPLRADEYSIDGVKWQRVPPAINVLGSRYALCIRDLREVDEILPLSATRVAVGNSRGKPGSEYVRGRVDKACLEVSTSDAPLSEDEGVQIRLVADVVDPFAVFLRA